MIYMLSYDHKHDYNDNTSITLKLSMPFSKSEMQKELLKFLNLFGKDIARLYGVGDAWTEKETIQNSPVWKAASEMYDYGIRGIPTEDLFPNGHIDGIHGYTERFFRGMDTPHMRLYLEESDNTPPRLAMLAVQSAVARMVLDGGWRHTDYGECENGMFKGDMGRLTIAEVALLANMDERSVRNAANPKLPDPLKTEQIGKRSLVKPEEGRRWLAGRKGYIPTQEYTGHRPPSWDITLPEVSEEFMKRIQREADETGFSVAKIFQQQILANLSTAFEKMEKK